MQTHNLSSKEFDFVTTSWLAGVPLGEILQRIAHYGLGTDKLEAVAAIYTELDRWNSASDIQEFQWWKTLN